MRTCALAHRGLERECFEVWDLARGDGRMFTIESTGSADPSS
jgi:hypothetical protein